jgi:HSP20 family protein
LSEDDFWSRWLRRTALWPYSRRRVPEYVDDVFMEMEDFMEREFSEFSENTPEELVRERTLPGGAKVREWGPFVYGYIMTAGPDGKPQIREFGNMKPETRMGRPHLDVKDKREPLTDVITVDNEVQVIIELPGVEKKDIKLRVIDDSLIVSVETPQRKYYKKLRLPIKVDLKTVKSSYKNGVLNVTLQKKKEDKPIGEPIKID